MLCLSSHWWTDTKLPKTAAIRFPRAHQWKKINGTSCSEDLVLSCTLSVGLFLKNMDGPSPLGCSNSLGEIS